MDEKESKLDFWSYMRSLTPQEWDRHIVYLTREQPKTSINGVGGYLTKLVQPFDQEEIKQAYGGREFSYIMKRDNKVLYSGRFSIEAPPRFDPQREANPVPVAAATPDPNSGVIKQFIDVLREELARSREQGGGNGSTERVMDMMTKASEKAIEIVSAQSPKEAGGLGQLVEVITLLKSMGMIATPQPAGGGIIETIRVLKELGLVGAPAAAADPATQLQGMLTIWEKLNDISGGGGGGGKGNWFSLVEKGLETLPQAISALATQRAAAPPVRGPAPHPSAARPAAPPPSAPTGAAGAAPSALRTEPLTRTIDQQPLEGTAVNDLPQMPPEEFDAWVKRNIVEMVFMGVDGGRIANFIYDHKPETLADLVKYPAPQITMFFAQDPILSKAVKHPNWQTLLQQTQQAAEEILADEADDAPEAVN